VKQPTVNVECLIATFFRQRDRHNWREPSTAPVGLPATNDHEPQLGQSFDIVDHLSQVGFTETSRTGVRRVYLQQELSDVVGVYRFYVDDVSKERPLGGFNVQLQHIDNSLSHDPDIISIVTNVKFESFVLINII